MKKFVEFWRIYYDIFREILTSTIFRKIKKCNFDRFFDGFSDNFLWNLTCNYGK